MLIALIGFPKNTEIISLIQDNISDSQVVFQETEEDISLPNLLHSKPDVLIFYELKPSNLELAQEIKERYPLAISIFMCDSWESAETIIPKGFESIPREAPEYKTLLAKLALIRQHVSILKDKNLNLLEEKGYFIGTDGSYYTIDKEFITPEESRSFMCKREDGQKALIKALSLVNKEEGLSNLMRFIQEAWVTIFKSHKNLAKGYDLLLTKDLCLYIREWVEGEPLSKLIKKGPISVEKAAEITVDIARAMQFYSTYKIVHRDISPSNIIITEEGAKLIDFGVAKVGNVNLSGDALTVGDPFYVSPQQITGAGGSVPDIRTDIYNLGATFYHMAVGKVPYFESLPSEGNLENISNAQLISWVEIRLKEDPTPPNVANPAIIKQYSSIIQKMMARELDARYKSPRDVIQDILKVLQRRETGVKVRHGRKGNLWEWMKNHKRNLLIVFLILFVIIGFVCKNYFPTIQLDLILGGVIIILAILIIWKRV